MGADWLKFKIRQNADPNEVTRLVSFVNQHTPRAHWHVVEPPPWDNTLTGALSQATEQLEALLSFARDREHDDFWSFPRLTDPPGVQLGRAPGNPPLVDELVICRVYVVSHNPVFPIEWREEAYRIITPVELPRLLAKWRTHIDNVNAGRCQHYLRDLHLYFRIHDEHQRQEIGNLLGWARDSLTRSNAWCKKDRIIPIRQRILDFDGLSRLENMRKSVPWPKYDESNLELPVSNEQLEREETYWKFRHEVAEQIREWNRCVPGNRKVQYPSKISFDDFLARARGFWLKDFFSWCDYLIDQECGLYLWQ